jgi:hypothetical protein
MGLWMAALALGAVSLRAADQPVMHCFAYTVIESATPAEWDAFTASTKALPGQIPGLTKVWLGKLSRPMTLVTTDAAAPAEDVKKLRAGETVSLPVKFLRRQAGVCMEFNSAAALAAYAKHDAHSAWMKTYEKVRVAGTTTIDILTQ